MDAGTRGEGMATRRARKGGMEGGRVGGDEKLVVMDLFDGKDVVVVGGCQG